MLSAARILQQNFYDLFSLVLSDISITLTSPSTAPSPLIPTFSLNVSLSNSVIPQDYTLARFKAHVSVDALHLKLGTTNLSLLQSLADETRAAVKNVETPYERYERAMSK